MKCLHRCFIRQIVFLLFASSVSSLISQPQEFIHYETYSDKEGYVSYGDATHCIEDEQSFLWFGSNKGLYRYDGTRFRLYSLLPDDTIHIPATKYLPLLLRQNQLLVWIENRGIYWFNIKNKEVHPLPLANNDPFFSQTKINAAYQFDSHSIWFTTLFNGIVRYDINSKQLHRHLASSDSTYNKSWVASSSCTNLAIHADSSFYVSTNDGLFHFDPKTRSFEKVDLPGRATKQCTITAVYIKDNQLYVCTWGHGLLIYHFTNHEWEQILWNKKEYNNAVNIVSSIIFKSDREIWISTIEDGVKKINLQNKIITDLVRVDQNGNAAKPTPWLLFKTTSDICWGTNIGVIYKFFENEKLLHFKPLIPELEESECNYFCPLPGDSTLYFINHKNGLLTATSLQSGTVQFYPIPAFISPFKGISAIHGHDNQYQKILVSNLESIFLFDTRYKKFEKIPFVSNLSLNKNYVVCTYDRSDNLWIAIQNKGLYRYDSKQHTLEEITTKTLNHFIPNTTSILGLQAASDGSLWISNWNGFGLIYYHHAKNKIIHYGRKYPILINNAVSICALKEDAIFICLSDWGLVMIKHPNTPQEKLYYFNDKKDGLPSNKFYQCMADEHNQVWLSGDHGIFQFNPNTLQIIHHFKSQQLVHHDIGNNLFRLPNAAIGIGVKQGFQYWYPQEINKAMNISASRAVLNDVMVGEKSISDSILSLAHLDMPYNEKLQFSLSALEYVYPEKVHYQYKLEGLEHTWQEAAAGQIIEYARLRGGQYRLRVRTSLNGTKWNEQAFKLPINVHPPFWEKAWFIILCSMLLIAVVYLIVRIRLNKIKKEVALQLSVRESELKALRSQMNPHFIFNCMNTLEAFISRNNEEQASGMVQKFSRLMRLVLENSQHPSITIRKDIEALELYIQLEQIRFKYQFDYAIKGIDYLDIDHIQIPPLIIQPFVENAILHGIRPLDHKGVLTISFEEKSDLLYITIDDNGVGRKGKSSSTHQSLGSSLSVNRINRLHHDIKSAVTYIDKKDLVGNPIGTTVVLIVPLLE